jgi:hypothetical protein
VDDRCTHGSLPNTRRVPLSCRGLRNDRILDAADAINFDGHPLAGAASGISRGVPSMRTSPACSVMNSVTSASSRAIERTQRPVLHFACSLPST